ncbi:hypothetical protein MKX07_000194 [Trichoderma sp. CBMAI-0711]|nr:hypothetical protein MKX07_000194 [Trichoderma sp. CBMAI-0711]
MANSAVDVRQRALPAPVKDSPELRAYDSSGASTPRSPRTPTTPSWLSKTLSRITSPKLNKLRFLVGDKRGQCTDPRDQECAGDQVSMLQRGPGPRPPSRLSSRSPISSERVAYSQFAPQRYDPAGASPDVGRAAQPSSKSFGVHNILNPADSHPMGPDTSGSPSSRARETESFHPASSTPYGIPRPYLHGHSASGSLPTTPVAAGVTPTGRPPISERNSPSTAYPFPVMSNPRKILSPRAPRALSLGQALPPRDLDTRQPLAPSMAPTKRPYEPDTPDEPRHAPGLHQPSGIASGPHTPMVTPPRSLSQPFNRPLDAPHTQPPTIPPPGELQSRPHGLHTPSHLQHGITGLSTTRPLSRMGGSSEGAPAWPEILRRQGGSFVGMESQQAYMTLPGSDTPIPVQVDYSQASKKADEKRQRNAKASTRHRRKKKTLQEENMKQLQELKEERQQMLQQLEELAAHRDFYRDDRNRLRDIVARTPAISNHAACPPSPVLSKSINFSDRSPLLQSHHIPTPTQGYASEVSSAERPVPVRRTDDRPDYSPPMYGALPSGPPHGLPSMHGHAYGVPPPRPGSAASSASGERLPPLRVMDGPPPPMSGLGPGQAHEQDLRTGQWRAAQPSHFETGWATAPRKHQEGSHW